MAVQGVFWNVEGVCLCVENVTVEWKRVLLREYHQEVLKALAHKERFHLVHSLRLNLTRTQTRKVYVAHSERGEGTTFNEEAAKDQARQ